MGMTENAGFSAKVVKVQRNLGLDFVKKTAQIIAKDSTGLQLTVSDMLSDVNFSTFAMADFHYGELILIKLHLRKPSLNKMRRSKHIHRVTVA